MFPVQVFTANFRPEGTVCLGEFPSEFPLGRFIVTLARKRCTLKTGRGILDH